MLSKVIRQLKKMKFRLSDSKPPKGTLRDRLLAEGVPRDEYYKNPPDAKDLSYVFKSKNKGTVVNDPEMSGQTEKQVVLACTRYLKSKGWITKTIYTGGIQAPSGRLVTNPAKGIPDCIAFNLKKQKIIWIEYKRSAGGKISPEQQQWHDDLRSCGQLVFVVTSVSSLIKQLTQAKLGGE